MAALLELREAASWQGQEMLVERFEARPTLLFGRPTDRGWRPIWVCLWSRSP